MLYFWWEEGNETKNLKIHMEVKNTEINIDICTKIFNKETSEL